MTLSPTTTDRITTALYDSLQTQVHVWFCQPAKIQDRLKLSEYESVLSDDEIERYHAMHFEKDKHSYLVSHALLRNALSKYADLPASQWQFSSNEHGKPSLLSPPAMPDIRFNLTHTDGLSACIITAERDCGIDAENKQRNTRLAAVAQRMFAEEELVMLDESNIEQQFYYYWTLREAYVKALGTGIAGSSRTYYFDIDNTDLSVALYHKNIQKNFDKNWRFKLYKPTQQHVLALCFDSAKNMQIVVSELIP